MTSWRPVLGYEGEYEVSSDGQVVSVKGNSARLMSQERIRTGHLRVTLTRNGEQRKVLVHRLMLEAFVGPCPEGMEACHANDERTHTAVLTAEQVLEARARHERGERFVDIAESFGVRPAVVSLACRGVTWKHVSWAPIELAIAGIAKGLVVWRQRGPEPARRVSGAVARLRRMRPRYYFDEACTQGRCAHPQSCPVRVARG